MNSATLFAAIAVTVYAAHQLADHVLGQTDRQAGTKAAPGWHGWRYNVCHIGQYHAVMTAMLATTIWVLDLPVTGVGLTAGIGFSAVTHALLDRRWPVRWLLEHTGAGQFSRQASHGINGMYLADQALHYACLWLSALLITGLSAGPLS
jgi:hypothetical protein